MVDVVWVENGVDTVDVVTKLVVVSCSRVVVVVVVVDVVGLFLHCPFKAVSPLLQQSLRSAL